MVTAVVLVAEGGEVGLKQEERVGAGVSGLPLLELMAVAAAEAAGQLIAGDLLASALRGEMA